MSDSKEPSLFIQAGVLVLLGALVGLCTDLVIPGGALAQRAIILRDLEAQVPVRLYTAEEAAQLHLQGDIILFDAREEVDTKVQHIQDSRRIPYDFVDRHQKELIEELAGQIVVIVLEADRSEDARDLAGRMVSGFSARSTGTVEGGWEALTEIEDLILIEGDAS